MADNGVYNKAFVKAELDEWWRMGCITLGEMMVLFCAGQEL